MHLGAVIKRLREARNWSAKDVDKAAGFTPGHTSVVETRASKRAEFRSVQRYAAAFGLTPSELWELAEAEADPSECAADEKGAA